MPTLYVENVPKDLYEALRARARKNRSSIAAEVIGLLVQFVPTPEELRRRKRAFEELRRIQASVPPGRGPFPSTEEMIREDRER
jgi:plasmid stability protein